MSGADFIFRQGPGVWPIVFYSYLMVRGNMTGMGESAALVKYMANFVFSAEGASQFFEVLRRAAPRVLVGWVAARYQLLSTLSSLI